MIPKLIIVEGLPGSGKTTVSNLIDSYLDSQGVETNYYPEGSLQHPADFEGAAFFTEDQFNRLLAENKMVADRLKEIAFNKYGGYLILYAREKKTANFFTEQLYRTIAEYDIYNLPFKQHIELISKRWEEFVQRAVAEEKTYVFECCFIQNPITTSMIRDNTPVQITFDYINRLNEIIKPLKPHMIYLKQKNVEESFKRVIQERPDEWLQFFINYYTEQGYGLAHQYQGLTGTIEVLKARREQELGFLPRLEINKTIIDNSSYDQEQILKQLVDLFNN